MTATYIRSLADEGLGLSEVGGKGQSLARLAAAGLPVPDGFHITTAAYEDFIAHSGTRLRSSWPPSLIRTAWRPTRWRRLSQR
jgi:hypothetical protein